MRDDHHPEQQHEGVDIDRRTAWSIGSRADDHDGGADDRHTSPVDPKPGTRPSPSPR